jgi:hypothetical protein
VVEFGQRDEMQAGMHKVAFVGGDAGWFDMDQMRWVEVPEQALRRSAA